MRWCGRVGGTQVRTAAGGGTAPRLCAVGMLSAACLRETACPKLLGGLGKLGFASSLSAAQAVMYTNFKDKAIDYVKAAVEADNAGEYQRALDNYTSALEYFKTHLKYEKNPRAKDAITAKV